MMEQIFHLQTVLEQIEELIEDATSKESLQRLGESCMDISIDQWIQSPEAARQE